MRQSGFFRDLRLTRWGSCYNGAKSALNWGATVSCQSECTSPSLGEVNLPVDTMSRRAAPYDNPHAESFIKTPKAEEVHLSEYEAEEEARQYIGRFLEDIYDSRHLH